MLPSLTSKMSPDMVWLKGIYQYAGVTDEDVILIDKMGMPVHAGVAKSLQKEIVFAAYPKGERLFCELTAKRVFLEELKETDLYKKVTPGQQETIGKMADSDGKFTPYFKCKSVQIVPKRTELQVTTTDMAHGDSAGMFEFIMVPNKGLTEQKWIKYFGDSLGFMVCTPNSNVVALQTEGGPRLAAFHEMVELAQADMKAIQSGDKLMLELRQAKLIDFVAACHDVDNLAFVLKDETYFNIMKYRGTSAIIIP